MHSSCYMAYNPKTSPITMTAAMKTFLFATPSTVSGVASVRRVTTISVTGSWTWPANVSPPSHARNDPFIFTGCAVKRPKEKPTRTTDTTVLDNTPPREGTVHQCNLLIRDLWQNGTISVHDMRVVNTDTNSNLAKTTEKCLQES